MRNRTLRIAGRVVLAVSLLLNVAVLGLYLRLSNAAEQAGLENTRFPRDVRQAFMKEAGSNPQILSRLSEVGDARRALLAAGDADPYDPDAVAAAMSEMSESSIRLRADSHAILAEIFLDIAIQDGRYPPR